MKGARPPGPVAACMQLGTMCGTDLEGDAGGGDRATSLTGSKVTLQHIPGRQLPPAQRQ